MKPTTIIGLVAIAVIVIFLLLAITMGWIPGLNILGDDENQPPGAVYCDYTDMQILDMLETVAGKDLDNGVGISYVRALNMEACASNDETLNSIVAYYKDLNTDWYISDDAEETGGGWTAHRTVWTNTENPFNATLIKAVLVGSGSTVRTAYGYDTITITSDGPAVTYGAFIIWVATS